MIDKGEFPILMISQEITSKKNWYSKIFKKDIVNRWKTELPAESADNFDFVVKLLQSTAQGSIHLPDCDWDEDVGMCRDCLHELKNQILNDPIEFGLTTKDISIDFFKQGWQFDFEDDFDCDHPRCNCTEPDSSLASYVDYRRNGVIAPELHAECKRVIAEIARKEPVDYHPGSNKQVRDLIHPSMYCYVKGVSKHIDGSVEDSADESLRYQWLPSEFTVDPNGTTRVASYINNLKDKEYPEFIPIIEKVFKSFVPSLEQVLKRNIRGKSLQVIVKVGQIILIPDGIFEND